MARRLFIGGPLDGQLIEVPHNWRTIRTIEAAPDHDLNALVDDDARVWRGVIYRPHTYLHTRLVPNDVPYTDPLRDDVDTSWPPTGVLLLNVIREPVYWTDDAWAEEQVRRRPTCLCTGECFISGNCPPRPSRPF